MAQANCLFSLILLLLEEEGSRAAGSSAERVGMSSLAQMRAMCGAVIDQGIPGEWEALPDAAEVCARSNSRRGVGDAFR